MKRILLFLFLGGLFLAVVEIGCLHWQYRRAFVVISNESGREISDLKIKMREGDIDVGVLGAGVTKKVQVFPHGESAFTISFGTPDGKVLSGEGSYVESTGGYEVSVSIAPDWSVSKKTSFMRGFIILRTWKWLWLHKS